MSSVVYAFHGHVPILPTNLILNPIIVSFSANPSLRVPFSILTLLSKKYLCPVVKFVENVFPFESQSTMATPVINTDSTVPTWSFTLCDYPTPPLVRPTSHNLLHSPPLPPHSSRRTACAQPKSLPPILPKSSELLCSSPSPTQPNHFARLASPTLSTYSVGLLGQLLYHTLSLPY